MTTLTITDLPRVDTLHRHAMTTTRGGIMTMTKPGSESTPTQPLYQQMSLPGAGLLTDLHLPLTLTLPLPGPVQVLPHNPSMDPRLQ